jgi:hypothetical protein
MKRIRIILPILIVFFLFVFLLRGSPQEKDVLNISDNYVFENPENYLIGKIGENALIHNQNLDFSFKVPEEWDIEGLKENFVSGIIIFSPDYKEDENFFIKDGCKTIITVYTEKNEYSYLKEKIKLLEETLSVVKIDGYSGKIVGEGLYFKNIKVPLDNNIYSFEGYFSEYQEEYCKKNYNSLINSISFKNEE